MQMAPCAKTSSQPLQLWPCRGAILAASGGSAVASPPQKPPVPMAVLRRFPFSSALRRMCVLGKAPGNSPVEAFMKGAPETVASLCKRESGLCPCPPAGSPLNPCHCMVCFVLKWEIWLRSLWEAQHRFPSESKGSGTSPSRAYEGGRGRVFLMLCKSVSCSPKGRSPLLPCSPAGFFPAAAPVHK